MADQAESSTAASAASVAPTLTQRDMEIVVHVLRCLKHDPLEIDINKFMVEAGFQSTKSASNAWSAIKKKVLTNAAPTLPAAGGAPKTPKTSRKTGGEASAMTPSKKTGVGETKTKTATKSGDGAKIDAASTNGEEDETHDSGHEDTTKGKGRAGSPSKAKDNDKDPKAMEADAMAAIPTNGSALNGSGVPVISPPSTPTPVAQKAPKAAALPKKAVAAPEGSVQAATSADSNVTVAKGIVGDAGTADIDASGSVHAVTPGGTKKRSRKPNVEPTDDAEANDSDEAAKPVKKARKTPAKKVVKEDATNNNDDDVEMQDGEAPAKTPATKKPRAPRTPKDPNAPPRKLGRPPGSRNKNASTDTTKAASKAKKAIIGKEDEDDQNEEDVQQLAKDASEVLLKKQKAAAPAKKLVPVVVVPELMNEDRVAKNSIDAQKMASGNVAKEIDEDKEGDTIESHPEIGKGNDNDTEMAEVDEDDETIEVATT